MSMAYVEMLNGSDMKTLKTTNSSRCNSEERYRSVYTELEQNSLAVFLLKITAKRISG